MKNVMTIENNELLVAYAKFLRETYRPAMDHFTDSTLQKAAGQFLLEEDARVKLDEEAIAEGKGYQSAAHKAYILEENRKKEEARAAAEQKAKDDAAKAEEDARIKKQLDDEAALKVKRDQEDAELAARNKAEAEAKKMGEAPLNLGGL